MPRTFVVGFVVVLLMSGIRPTAAVAAQLETDCLGPLPPRFYDYAPMDSQYAAERRLRREVHWRASDPERLDAWLSELRRTKPRLPDGSSQLGIVTRQVGSILGERGDALVELARNRPGALQYRLALETKARLEGWTMARGEERLRILREYLSFLETDMMAEAEAAGDPEVFAQATWACLVGEADLPVRLRVLRRGLAVDPGNTWVGHEPLVAALGRPDLESWLAAIRETVPPADYEDILARAALDWVRRYARPQLSMRPKLPWKGVCAGLRRVMATRIHGGEQLTAALFCAGLGEDRELGAALLARLDLTGHPRYGVSAPTLLPALEHWARGTADVLNEWWRTPRKPTPERPEPYERTRMSSSAKLPPTPADARLAWAHHVLVDGFARDGRHDGRWDGAILVLLSDWARITVTSVFADAALTRRVAVGMATLVGHGCKDPLVRLANLELGHELLTVADDDYCKGLETLSGDFRVSPYGLEIKAEVERLAAEAADRSPAASPEEREALRVRSLNHRCQAAHYLGACSEDLATPPWRALEMTLARRDLIAGSNENFPIYGRPSEEGLVDAVAGLAATEQACSSRDQPDLAARCIEGAQTSLRAAWEANKTLPEVARAMVTVSHLANRPRQELTSWFERARALAPRAQATYGAMLATLLPRTADDEEPLLAFADQLVGWQTELNEPRLLDTLLTAHRWIAEARIRLRRLRPEPGQHRAELIAAAGPWREDRVRRQIDQALASALTCTAGTATERSVRTKACVQALLRGDLGLARLQAAALGGDLDESVEFWQWARDRLQAAGGEPEPPQHSWFGLSLDGGR